MKTSLVWFTVASWALAAEPKVHRDLPYAEPQNKQQTLDIYVPQEGERHPVVFWIHGGGWQRGDKAEVDSKPQLFIDRGYLFVSTNYRFVPDVTIDEMAGDVAQAIAWVHGHAAEYHADPNQLIVTGHSAGAQLAALVCTDNSYLKHQGLTLSFIRGCVPVDGDTYDVPLQIATVEQRRKEIYGWKFGDEASQRRLSPITHVAKGRYLPPVLILHVADHPETTAQSNRLVEALTEVGVSAKTFAAEGTDHVKLNADLGQPDDKPTEAMLEFISGVLKK